MDPRTIGERLAVIEEIALRIEAKVDDQGKRLSVLERAFAYASGAVTVITTGLVLYIRSLFPTK
jgi:hypothetical protein